jgi:transposase InsO family protein
MADKVVPMDVRAIVVTWPEDSPRGAVTRFCEEHHVSRSWFYEVRELVAQTDPLTAMHHRPRLPQARSPKAVPLAVEDLAVGLRKDLADRGLDHGPVTVRHHLARLGVQAPAASTLARLFTRRGMVTPQPQKRPKSSYRRFEFGQVHECWQLDSFEWPLADATIVAVFQLLDDRSRFMVASHVAAGETAADALLVVAEGINRHQVPQLLLTDNGTAFNQDRRGRTSQLVAHLTTLGCRPITGRPRHPQTQGKDERVHQTTQRWLRAQPPAQTIAELQAQVDAFDTVYNQHRPHQSLGMRTPAQALAEGPIAIPPLPPAPAPTPAAPVTAQTRHVTSNGKIKVNYAQIQLGHEHNNTTVTVIVSGQSVTIFSAKGIHIRSLTLTPGVTYYGNGRPRGRPKKTNRPD